MSEDDLLEPEESEETIPDELGFADEVAETEEVQLPEGEETIEELEGEGEAEFVEDLGEETVEEPLEEEAAGYVPAVAEPEGPPPKATNNVYTVMLLLAFLFFTLAIWLAGAESHEFYGWKAFGLLD